MIISDTTSVNTGRLNVIVVKLQKKMNEMGLDRMVRHVLEFYISSKTTKPSFDYKFVEEITKHYTELQPHIQQICSKLSSGSWAILKLRQYADLPTLKTVYFSLIYSHCNTASPRGDWPMQMHTVLLKNYTNVSSEI